MQQLDPKDLALVASLVGKTIVKADWLDACPTETYAEHEYLALTLDDGRKIHISSWGYDASRVDIADVTGE